MIERDLLTSNPSPKCLWVGIGCQRGVSKLAIQQAIESVFTQYNLDLATIAGIATLDRKASEVGLVDYCRESGFFLKTYPPERLNSVTVEGCSQLVSVLVGTASVAEAAALSAAQTQILLVPKQKFRLDAESRSITLAIAQNEYQQTRTDQIPVPASQIDPPYR
jgi:cobalamin biosynthesis protein CbiG